MDPTYMEAVMATLRAKSVPLERGLTDQEVSLTEDLFGFVFPPDLKALLQFALPVGEHFPDWRNGSKEKLRERLAWPSEGLRFDVEQNALWLPDWGPKPEALNEALAVARSEVAAAPILIPVYSHRYIPAEPPIAGNPVYSVYQTDIIYYGADLACYLYREFRVPPPSWAARSPRSIRFWSDLIASADAQGDPSLQ
jgi:hypothetical protein